MTEKEAFHFGFLLRCAEEGLGEAETAARMRKAASGPVSTAVDALGTGVEAVKGLLGAGARATAIAAPLAAVGGYGLGRLGGAMASRALDPGYTPEEINRQELLATYSDLAAALEDRVRRKQEQAAR